MSVTSNNPFVPALPIPVTTVSITDGQSPVMEVDVPQLFRNFGDKPVMETVEQAVTQVVRSLEGCVRGYDADMKGAERAHEIDRSAINGLKKELEENLKIVERQDEDIDRIKTNHRKDVFDLSEANTKLLNKNFNLQDFNGKILDEKKVLERQVAELTIEIKNLREDYRVQEIEVENLREDLQGFRDQCDDLQKINHALQQENDYLRDRVNDSVDYDDRLSTKQAAALIEAVLDRRSQYGV